MNKPNFQPGATLRLMWKKRKCYALLLPFFSLFTIFTVIPVIAAMVLSLTYYNILQAPQFIGLGNYVQLLFYDDIFQQALMNTLTMAIFIGPLGYLLSLLVAWMINELSPKVRSVLILLLYAPSISGNLYVIWTIILNGDSYGYVNGALLNMGMIKQPIQFLTDPQYMMGVVILVSLWMSLGTSFLAFIAGLQGVDKSLYEAGTVDGITNRWQELWFITLPSMRPQLLFGAIMSITASFAVGEVTTSLCGNPSTDYAVQTMINHITDYGGTRFEMGYACAISTILFVMMIVTNKIIQRLLKKVGN